MKMPPACASKPKWTWFAILYQCGFAYAISLMINQFGGALTGHLNPIGLIFAIAVFALMFYMLFIKKYQESTTLTEKLRTSSGAKA